jgi:hypothetical protein
MLLSANPVLEAAHVYWRSLPRAVNIPDIRLIDPATLPREILPHILIAAVSRGNFDLGQLRLCGHEIARWFRDEPEGMAAAALARQNRPYADYMRQLVTELVRHRQPIYSQSVYTLPGLTDPAESMLVTAERLALPMADGGTAVECIVMVETLSATDDRAGPLRILPPDPTIPMRNGPFEVVH